jgi:hypothetical protein
LISVGFRVVAYAGIDFQDDRWGDDVSAADAQSGFGEAVALAEEPDGGGSGSYGITLLLSDPGLAEIVGLEEPTVDVSPQGAPPRRGRPIEVKGIRLLPAFAIERNGPVGRDAA